MWILLYLSYNLGATRFLGYYTGISRESFNRLGRWLNNPMTANLHGIKAPTFFYFPHGHAVKVHLVAFPPRRICAVRKRMGNTLYLVLIPAWLVG